MRKLAYRWDCADEVEDLMGCYRGREPEPGSSLSLAIAQYAASPMRPRPSFATEKPYYQIVSGLAVVPFKGWVTGGEDTPWSWYFGGDASTTIASMAIRYALDDPEVQGIFLDVDSGGGYLDGVWELAELIWASRKIKPIIGYGSNAACSAAYWPLSQCSRVYVSANCEFGSIGIIGGTTDSERLYLNEGIRRVRIRTGRFKGIGTGGVRITAEEEAELQRQFDGQAELFYSHVARARGLTVDDVRAMEARVFSSTPPAFAGGEALIDGVRRRDELLAELAEQALSLPPVGLFAPLEPPGEDENDLDTESRGAAAEGGPMATNTPAPAAVPATPPAPATLPVAAQAAAPADLSAALAAALGTALGPVLARVDALAVQVTAMAPKIDSAASGVTQLTGAGEREAIEARARREVRITKGNEAYLVPALNSAFEVGGAQTANAFVDSLPVLGKADGSIVNGTAALPSSAQAVSPAPVVRHRFDAIGPEVWGKDPAMAPYAAKLRWIQAQEAGGTKYTSALEAFTAAGRALAQQKAA